MDVKLIDLTAPLAGTRIWPLRAPQTAIATLARVFHGYPFHADWQPYLVIPPFPDFVSSHSTQRVCS
jgi:hypothetical protein